MLRIDSPLFISILLLSSTLIGCISESDVDSDDVADKIDNCPEIFNPEQLDYDSDEVCDL